MSAAPRRFNGPAFVVFVTGLVVIGVEAGNEAFSDRLGPAGRTLAWIIGGCLVLIGFQLLAAGLMPGLLRHRGARELVRHRFYLPTEGRVAIAILITTFVGAMIGRNNTLLFVFSLLAAPFILNGFATFALLKRMNVERHLPERAEACRPLPVELILSNRRRFIPAWLMSVRDEVRAASPTDDTELFPQVTFLRVSPRSSGRATYRLRLPRRGRYTFGPAQLNTRFPIGLVERGIVMDVAQDLLVHPRIGRLSTSWRRRLSRGPEVVAVSARAAGSSEDDFHRVREYQSGDDPRSVHWPTSARMGEPVVREYRESRDRPLAVLVDLWSQTDGPQYDERVDLALDLAATLIAAHLRGSQQSRAFCGVLGSETILWDSATRGDFDRLLDRLAVAEARPEDDAADLVSAWSRRQRRGERVVWVTTRPAETLPDFSVAVEHGGAPADLQVLPADPEFVNKLVRFDVA